MDFLGFEPCRGLHLDLPEIEGSPFMAVMFYWKVKFLSATASTNWATLFSEEQDSNLQLSSSKSEGRNLIASD